VFSRDPGAIGSQNDSTSYSSTTLDQAPRFFEEPSGVPTQLDEAWPPMTSREQALILNQSYRGATTQLQRDDQPTVALAQAPIFSPDCAGAAGQSPPASYPQSFASGEASGQTAIFSQDHGGIASNYNRINSRSTALEHDATCFPDLSVMPTQQNSIRYSTATSVQAPIFSRDPGGVGGRMYQPAYFSGGTDQVSTSYQDSSGVSDQFDRMGNLEDPSRGFVSSRHMPMASDHFGDAGYLAADSGQAATFLQNLVGVSR